MAEDVRETKKARIEKEDDDDDGEEMEIDDEEESKNSSMCQYDRGWLGTSTLKCFTGVVPPAVQQPSARLLCTNLPMEVTDDVLSVLFQQ